MFSQRNQKGARRHGSSVRVRFPEGRGAALPGHSLPRGMTVNKKDEFNSSSETTGPRAERSGLLSHV